MRTEVLHEFEKIPLFNISSIQWIELLALQETDKLPGRVKHVDFYCLALDELADLAGDAQCASFLDFVF